MSYPGNPSLEPEIQERITATFKQTLELASQQKEQEARLGCEFILRMDPRFAPAQKLLARLKGEAPPAAEPPPSVGDGDLDLDSLDDLADLPELEDLDAAEPAAAEPAAPATSAAPRSGLVTVVEDLIARRNFQQVLQLAESQRDTVLRDPRLQELVATAAERAESQPFVETFLAKAREARAAGREEDVEKELAKARQLDPGHPEIAELAAPASATTPAAALDDFAALQAASLSLGGDDEDEAADDDSFAGLLDDDSSSAVVPPDTPGADDDDGDDDLLAFDDADDDLLALDDERAGGPAAGAPVSGDHDLAADLGDLDGDLAADDAVAAAPAAAVIAGDDAGDDLLAFDDAAGDTADDDDFAAEGFELDAAEPSAAPRGGRIGAADDSGDRVQQLLDEGQAAFERDEYQAAIDVWSRIFLIEIDNAEASRRIEAARNRKAELDRQAEEVFHEAVSEIQAGDLDAAAVTLGRVLELAPHHLTARDYLEQIEAGQTPAVRKRDVAEAEGLDDDDLLPEMVSTDEGKSLEAAVARDRVVVVKKTNKAMMIGGGALLAVLVLGGLYLVTHWSELFPNAEPPVAAAPPRLDPIARATQMHESGNTESALVLLRRLGPDDPRYAEATALVAQWEALVDTPADLAPTGPDQAAIARRRQLVDAAATARAEGFHRRAVELLSRAGRIAPLDTNEAAWKRQSEASLQPLREPIATFVEGGYEDVIPELWRLREKEPDNRDVEELLVDSYYNLALRQLQRGNAAAAVSVAEEGVEVQPGNEEMRRLHLFAKAYERRPQDLLYRIFVKYMPPRG